MALKGPIRNYCKVQIPFPKWQYSSPNTMHLQIASLGVTLKFRSLTIRQITPAQKSSYLLDEETNNIGLGRNYRHTT